MRDIKRDGKPHTAVGIAVEIEVRTGVGTAYPHPNQFHHNRIKKGDALQVAGVVTIAGCGGELYRGMQIAPWDPTREKIWQVHTDSCRIQAEESAAGVTCSYVAKKVTTTRSTGACRNTSTPPRPRPGLGRASAAVHHARRPHHARREHDVQQRAGVVRAGAAVWLQPLGRGAMQLGSVPYAKEWCTLKA
jgi:hypothetical protein